MEKKKKRKWHYEASKGSCNIMEDKVKPLRHRNVEKLERNFAAKKLSQT